MYLLCIKPVRYVYDVTIEFLHYIILYIISSLLVGEGTLLGLRDPLNKSTQQIVHSDLSIHMFLSQ